jgi:hypothetical protein
MKWWKERLYAFVALILAWIVILLAMYGGMRLYDKYFS